MPNSPLVRALLVAAVVPCLGQAQSAPHLDTLYVGSVHLAGGYLRNDSSEFVVLAPDSSAPGGTRAVGRLTTRWRVVDTAGGALFRINHFAGPSNDVTDSIMSLGRGLVPLWETSHQTSKLMHLRWNGRHVTGDVTPTGKSAERVDQTMAVPAFNSSDGTLIIGALPLTPGYRALFATYEYEVGGLRLDTLSVVGRERLTMGGRARDAVKVRVSRGGGSWMMIWLDAASRDLLQQEFGSAARGWVLRIRRS